MGLWENNLAASLTYQDLGDCSLGSLPAVAGLEKAKEEKSEPVSLKRKKQEMAVVKIMKKACGVLIMMAVGMITKFM